MLSVTVVLKNKEETHERVELNVVAKAIILMDSDTGKVIYKENSSESLPIASMSKLMTQYLVLNAVKSGTLSWDSTYNPSEAIQTVMAVNSSFKV